MAAQEPSLLPDLSARAANEYSDLLALSGTSFFALADPGQMTFESDEPLAAHKPDTSALIDLSATPLALGRTGHRTLSHPESQAATPRDRTFNLMDHTISNFNLIHNHILSPTSPSARTMLAAPTSPKPLSQRCTPPNSPGKNTILSTPAAVAAMSPLSHHTPPSIGRKSGGSTMTRTQSFDLLGLDGSPAMRTPLPRSKSSTAVASSPSAHQPSHDPFRRPPQTAQSKATKSILKRANSPSKGARARFFSPRNAQSAAEGCSSDTSIVDEHGNLRARETVHEFVQDEPPSQTRTPRRPRADSTPVRRHLPKFLVPEPAELDIAPILPRQSTSPSPSPPALSAARYLSDAKSHHRRSSSAPPSASDSLRLSASENLSNILDESGGFLGEDTTWGASDRERSTEQSIDQKHVVMLELLAKQKLAGVASRLQPTRRADRYAKLRSSEKLESPLETDELSVDVDGLVKQMEGTRSVSEERALNEEQAPHGVQASQDFSATFEVSRLTVPALLTDVAEVWKNSKPCGALGRSAVPAALSEPGRRVEPGGREAKTARLVGDENVALSRDKLFEELMAAPPPPLTSRAKPRASALATLESNKTVRPPRSAEAALPRPPARKRLSVPGMCARSPLGKATPGGTSLMPRTSVASGTPARRLSAQPAIGIGLPSTATRTKVKPTTAVRTTNGSPRVLKSRSSISSAMNHSPRPSRLELPRTSVVPPSPLNVPPIGRPGSSRSSVSGADVRKTAAPVSGSRLGAEQARMKKSVSLASGLTDIGGGRGGMKKSVSSACILEQGPRRNARTALADQPTKGTTRLSGGISKIGVVKNKIGPGAAQVGGYSSSGGGGGGASKNGNTITRRVV